MNTTVTLGFSRCVSLCRVRDRRHRLSNLSILACLLLTTSVASARTFTLEKISRGTQEFAGSVSYEVEKAYAGNPNLEVTISLNTKGSTNHELVKIDSPDSAQIRFKEISRDASFDPATGLQTVEYKYLVDIPAGTEPRIYSITLSLAYPNEKNINRSFWLYAGVRNKGKLNVVADGVSTTEFYTGTDNTYRLDLENNFPDYPVNVRSVAIKSDPAGLIESTTIPIGDFSIDPLQRRALDLPLKATSMSFSNLLSGFNDSTRLILNVTYDDGYGRVITDLSYPLKVKIRARDRILVIAMLFGVIIGAVLKVYLQRLQHQGIITRREKLVAIGITSLIGLVVSFVAVVGRIKIIAFDQMGSYDNPAVIFVISLAGAVGGAQLLSTFFSHGSSTPDAPPAPPAPAVRPVS